MARPGEMATCARSPSGRLVGPGRVRMGLNRKGHHGQNSASEAKRLQKQPLLPPRRPAARTGPLSGIGLAFTWRLPALASGAGGAGWGPSGNTVRGLDTVTQHCWPGSSLALAIRPALCAGRGGRL